MGINEEILAKIREKVNRSEGKFNDPFKFTPPSLRPKEEKSWYFIVLPAVEEGDTVFGGKKATKGMDGIPWIKSGQHWLPHSKQMLECPRVFQREKCQLCDLGFRLMDGVEDQAQRSALRDQYLPREAHVINAYFPPIKGQPEDVAGKVLWFPVSQRKVNGKFVECLNRDASSSSDLKPQPYGIFWPFDDGDQKGVCYVYELHATRKGGTKYNDYDGSDFLVKSRAPIANYLPDGVTYDWILAQRHDLWSKFKEPDSAKVQKAVDEIIQQLNTDPAPANHSGGDDNHGDAGGDDGGSDSKLTLTAPKTTAAAPAVAAAATTTAPAVAVQAEAAPAKAEATAASPDQDPALAAMVARLTGKAKK